MHKEMEEEEEGRRALQDMDTTRNLRKEEKEHHASKIHFSPLYALEDYNHTYMYGLSIGVVCV